MKVIRFFFFGKPGVAGLSRWEYHLMILIGLLMAKAVAGGLESIERLLAVTGDPVPGYISASGPAADLLFWPTAFLALYLIAAVIPIRIVRDRTSPPPQE